ncbi:hypothetical protein CHLRE_03g171387v5 [Chlamydomonas reinhardtii]|uniref:Uncharacterized protein n=1 Tax=Chlamydomonas reinhardtii TaxID=3055 RepID=A0A2K3DX42_CHLRE|nr:uncharacterized protein CHLRE_03g171387v5 [Chlamydomonas reinhardtii]PNW85094.1 hypothetical protein CHLRE_03g171387v5 [Chlamydomonas reinhardtii]
MLPGVCGLYSGPLLWGVTVLQRLPPSHSPHHPYGLLSAAASALVLVQGMSGTGRAPSRGQAAGRGGLWALCAALGLWRDSSVDWAPSGC